MRSVRRLIAFITASGLLLLSGPLDAGAAGTGVIKGRILNASHGRPQAGVRVTLTGANQDGSERQTESVRTDRSGRFGFRDLKTGEERVYAIDAHFQGGLFAGRPISLPSDTAEAPIVISTLQVWDTTRDPATVLITRDDMFVVLAESGLGIIEAVRIVNQTDDAYIGRARSSGRDQAPSFGFSLPDACERSEVAIRDATLDIPQIMCTDFGFGIKNALPPGETRMTFSYRLLGETATFDLTRSALYDIGELSVFAAEPLKVESNRLHEADEVTLADKTYVRWTSDSAIQPGDPIQLAVTAEAQFPLGLTVGIGATTLLVVLLSYAAIRRSSRREPQE